MALGPRNDLPCVVYFESCHWLRMCRGSALLTVDEECLRAPGLQAIRFRITQRTFWTLTWTNRCLCTIPARGLRLISSGSPWSEYRESSVPTRSQGLAWTLWYSIKERVPRSRMRAFSDLAGFTDACICLHSRQGQGRVSDAWMRR